MSDKKVKPKSKGENMIFEDYKVNDFYTSVKEQHNIMVFMGNGFDISVLRKYGNGNSVPSYVEFYDYLIKHKYGKNNLLVKQMKIDKKNKCENWSDFEATLGKLVLQGHDTKILSEDLDEIQKYFLDFLNGIVTTDILQKISKEAQDNEWSTYALSHFLKDLKKEDFQKMIFPTTTQHKHLFNYLFVNFNYTSLFDNYIYLDKAQFRPRIYQTSDRNFNFYPNPNGFLKNDITHQDHGKSIPMQPNDSYSTYIIMNVTHPHGNLTIPRSVLFGTEEETKDAESFNKSFWAQTDLKYGKCIENANLFIIYGMSLGASDSWWWKRIYNSLLYRDAELIIYYYDAEKKESDDRIKDRFIKSCNMRTNTKDIQRVKEKIYVVLYKDSYEIAFGFHGKGKDEMPQQSKLLNGFRTAL